MIKLISAIIKLIFTSLLVFLCLRFIVSPFIRLGYFLNLDYIIIRFKTNVNNKNEKKRIIFIIFIYNFDLKRYH